MYTTSNIHPFSELLHNFLSLCGMDVINTTVGNRSLNEITESYCVTKAIFSSFFRPFFLKGLPQGFKPILPVKCYVICIDFESFIVGPENVY